MMPRDSAALVCRALAFYCGLKAIQQLPAVLVAVPGLATALPGWLPLAALGLWIAAVAGLWTQSARIARWISPTPRRDSQPPERTLAQLLFVLAGLLVLLDVVAELAGMLAPLVLERRAAFAASPAVLAVMAVKLAGGLGLLFGAPWLASRLVPRRAAPVADTRLPRALGELIGNVGSVGLNKLTDLALTLKAEAEGMAIQAMKSSMDAVIAAVQRRRPDLSGAASADGTVTIVFSDMEGFSAMTERLGDRRAHKVIKLHNEVVRKELERHGGQEVELQGDGFLLAFGDPAAALRCAVAIQRAFAKLNARRPAEPIRVRIGLHTGTPIKEGDRFFGITVILAARIAGQAVGGEVLVSAVVQERYAGDAEFAFGPGREAELKGLAGVHRMHELLWQQGRAAVGS